MESGVPREEGVVLDGRHDPSAPGASNLQRGPDLQQPNHDPSG